MSQPKYDQQYLPESLREINDLIGFDATLKLVKRWGGQEITIPKRLLLTHDLCFVLGVDEANKLSWALGGYQLEVPICKRMMMAWRNEQIRQQAQQCTLTNLAKKFGLTVRQIRSIVNCPDRFPVES